MCLKDGMVTVAQVADHVVPHHGDQDLFWFGKLQSLCHQHHNTTKRELDTKDYSKQIGEDGWPVDRNHPVYRR
jgi:hypothetical protein